MSFPRQSKYRRIFSEQAFCAVLYMYMLCAVLYIQCAVLYAMRCMNAAAHALRVHTFSQRYTALLHNFGSAFNVHLELMNANG